MPNKSILITGGAGFIGINTARYFAQKGWQVSIFDNLSRKGVIANLEWLKNKAQFDFIKGDICDFEKLKNIFQVNKFGAIIHLAAQVAVTTSVKNPREDFEVNALGTFNVLEAARNYCPESPFIYASTNKVYGKMEALDIIERNGRYEYLRKKNGIDENFPLDFYSPYGCSKGAGDQYVLDYARIYNLPTFSFRQSCIYGTHQFGVEDQGWVAWFIIAILLNKRITIFGDGKQIRDILHVDDLVRAYELAIEKHEQISGSVFNIGGGPKNTLSLLELIGMLEKLTGKKIEFRFDNWRQGDQKVFVSNIEKANELLGWEPTISTEVGCIRLYEWIHTNRDKIQKALE